MTCERMEQELIAYLDGRAAAAQRREVEEHLAVCADCGARAAEFQGVSSLLDEYPAAAPSPYFDARLRSRLAGEARLSWWYRWIPQPRLALATAALFALGLWISAVPPEAPPPTAAQADEEFRMIRDMHVLENYDVLAEFDALSELPSD
jgi:anti-sigma factor RsiW